ncbi:cortactin-binding protein 2 [Cynoglossus semilaevis]|uniref:cortactin-binding protein 2 n=1 Tax=Cynoglossus semilaevis TaxID=244447 RepID=UPI0004968519|nr:cortactin-binding protein 2 [Cynoglossus semilaevis]
MSCSLSTFSSSSPKETDRYLLEFRGGSLSLSAIGSFKGNNVGGGRKGRDSSKLRRSNTSPRKKGSPALNWSCGSSFREGSLSNSDLSFTNGTVQRETVGLSVFSDDETDLIRELQSMCSSKSEPDISKISQTKDDLFLFSSVSSQESKTQKPEQETNVQQEQQRTTVAHQSFRSSDHTDVQSSNRRSTGLRAKSQLPVPSSRGQQARASTAATTGSSSNNNNHSSSSSSSSKSPIRTQTPPNRSRNSSSSNNNYYHRNNIDNNRSHEDIWILHRDLHENK